MANIRFLNKGFSACKCEFCEDAAKIAKLFKKPESDLIEIGVRVKKPVMQNKDSLSKYSWFAFFQCKMCGTLWLECMHNEVKEYILLSKSFKFISRYAKSCEK